MSKSTHEVFMANLRRRLRELGLTQRQLAHRTGWTEAYVSQILSGRNVPRLDLVDRIAPALRTTPLYLLTPAEIPESEKNLDSAVDAA